MDGDDATERTVSSPTAVALARDQPHHVLAVPASDQQLWEVSARFVADGLAAGEQVAYFDDGTVDCVLERLADDGVEVDDSLRRGQFQVMSSDQTRAAVMAPLDELAGLLHGYIQSAVDAGWAGVRMTGQSSHGLRRPGGPVFDEYDAVLDKAVCGRPARVLCLYDEARFPADLVAHMRQIHAFEAAAPSLYDDVLLRITATGPQGVRLAGEIDQSNSLALRRLLGTLLDRALRSHSAPATITVDLASLRFVDVAGAVSLVHAAEEFPSTHRLVLDRVRPAVARVLDRCGAPFAPQLDLRPRPDTGGPTCLVPFGQD